ncbi:hypothetical protein DAI22_05g174800 [Oryza sativa Japonica Group]|nr:hypothetical protein DAI22_05g174800 [Oryza sativa Japonica Group]
MGENARARAKLGFRVVSRRRRGRNPSCSPILRSPRRPRGARRSDQPGFRPPAPLRREVYSDGTWFPPPPRLLLPPLSPPSCDSSSSSSWELPSKGFVWNTVSPRFSTT